MGICIYLSRLLIRYVAEWVSMYVDVKEQTRQGRHLFKGETRSWLIVLVLTYEAILYGVKMGIAAEQTLQD